MSTAFFTLDRDWRFTYVNARGGADARPRRDDAVRTRDCGRCYPELRGDREPTSTTGRRWDRRPRGRLRALPPAAGRLVRRPRDPERGRASASTSTTSPAACAPSRTRRGSPASARRRSPPAARRPAGCRSSARASARLAGTLEVDELLRILSDVVLNGFGEGLVVALEERIIRDLAGKETTPTGGAGLPRRARRRRRRRRSRPPRSRPPRSPRRAVQDREAHELDERLGSRARAARSRSSRAGRMLGAVDRDRTRSRRARPARADRTRRARRASRSTTRCSSAPSGGSR